MRGFVPAGIAAALAVSLAGCVTVSARKIEHPGAAWVSASGLDSAASCVVQALNRTFVSPLGVRPPSAHSINIIDPGRVYEVKPQQPIVIGTDVYYVRVTKVTETQANIELFAISPYFEQIARDMTCGTRV